MAELNDQGNIRVRCPGCHGALASYEWRNAAAAFGAITTTYQHRSWSHARLDYRLFKCGGCGRGGIGVIVYGGGMQYPGAYRELFDFYPETKDRLPLPQSVPVGIVREFREGETCLDSNAIRAAAGMFRSVLDKTLRANGYKLKGGTTLEQQIDMASDDGVITQARRRRAHEEIRVLGNDVLHDEWHEIAIEDVQAARHYAQRVLEDFYDDRESVLKQLRDAGKIPDEDKKQSDQPAS